MFDWFRKKPRDRAPDPQTRLTRQEALEIAVRAAAGNTLVEYLTLVSSELRAGSPVWIVSSVTRGLQLVVTIDDASGEVLGVETIGVR
jgi:hypothetical protein